MNYNDKIKEIHKNIWVKYRDLLQEMGKVVNRGEYKETQAGVTIPINKEEANLISQKANKLTEELNAFDYYTTFYPNKETIWEQELTEVNHIKSILTKLAIDKNIKDYTNA